MTDEERRLKARDNTREYRAKLRADPVKYRALLDERARIAREKRANAKADPEAYKAKLARQREWQRRWHELHPEKEHEYHLRKYEKRPEYYAEKNSRWFKEHREWDNQRKRERYASDPAREQKLWAQKAYTKIIEPHEFPAIWERLHGPCDICGVTKNGERTRMHLDHDHKTNKFRGALCHRCNLAIGHFDDDPALLRKAAEYLERN